MKTLLRKIATFLEWFSRDTLDAINAGKTYHEIKNDIEKRFTK